MPPQICIHGKLDAAEQRVLDALPSLPDQAILVENWEGEAPIIPLIREILDKEHGLIGEERDRILWYTGCAQLVG